MKYKCQKGYKQTCGTCKHLSDREFNQTCEECFKRNCPLAGDIAYAQGQECKGCLWEPVNEQ